MQLAPRIWAVDADQGIDLLADVAPQIVRHPKEALTDPVGREVFDPAAAAIGATVATDLALQSAWAQAQATIPPEWTDGLRSATATRRTEGYFPIEGGWGLDPSAADLVAASFERVVQHPTLSTTQRDALQTQFVQSVATFEDMANSARQIDYDFRMRGSLTRSTLTATTQRSLPWISAMRYEHASRVLDGTWAALRISHEAGASRALAAQLKNVYTAVPAEVGVMVSTLMHQLAARIVAARTSHLRLLMLAPNVDGDDSAGGTVDRSPGGQVVESLYFGEQHAPIASLILTSTAAEGLRYLFGAERREFLDTPAFSYRCERVAIDLAPTGPLTAEGAAARIYGVRVTLPPAPQGYLRGGVLMLFRSLLDLPPADAATEWASLRTDLVVVGNVPDEEAYTSEGHGDGGDGTDPAAPAVAAVQSGSVADLPASFVVYHSGAGDPTATLLASDVASALQGQFVVSDAPTIRAAVTETTAQLRWQAMADLARLEQISGDDGRTHPVANIRLAAAARAYFSPVASVADPDGLTPNPRLELFVELVPTGQTADDMRRARRVVARREGGRQPGRTVAYFAPPSSLTAMHTCDLVRQHLWEGVVVEMQTKPEAFPPALAITNVGAVTKRDRGIEALLADLYPADTLGGYELDLTWQEPTTQTEQTDPLQWELGESEILDLPLDIIETMTGDVGETEPSPTTTTTSGAALPPQPGVGSTDLGVIDALLALPPTMGDGFEAGSDHSRSTIASTSPALIPASGGISIDLPDTATAVTAEAHLITETEDEASDIGD